MLGLLVAVITGILVLQLREQALNAARHEMQNLALTLADQAERAFEAVDLVQTTFVEMAQTERMKTPGDFRREMSTLETNQQLIAHGRALPQLAAMGLVDPDGMIVNFNKPWPLPAKGVADRNYFASLKADPALTRVVSEPLLNNLDGAWTVVIAHSIIGTGGRLLGVSFAGVLMRYFEDLYETVINTRSTSIALLRSDGLLLARYPRVDGSIGQSFAQSPIVRRLAASGAEDVVIQQTGLLDGVEKLIAGHKLAHYPMLVSVSASTASILTPFHQETAFLIGAAVILEVVVVGVGMLMQRQLRSQQLLALARVATVEAENARRGAEAELALGQERERTNRALQIQAVRFGAALGNMSEVLCLFDAADRLIVGNDRLAAMFDLPVSRITHLMTIQDIGALLAPAPGMPPNDPQKLHDLILRLRDSGMRDSEALDSEDGRRIAVNFAPMADDGWLVTLEDMTEQRRSEARIDYMAHHDALTGLANRILFHTRLDHAVACARRGDRYAVLYLDLDHFKAVNDTLGHPAGDALLRDVTQRLRLVIRETDTIARLGGDEFAVVQSIVHTTDSTALATRLIQEIGAPYDINGSRVVIGTSIGIALVPDDGEDADEIIKSADMALYRSKTEGRGRYQFFEAAMNAHMQARRTLDLDLRKALAEGEFRVFYQPLVTIADRTVCGFEALVRWQHPERGMVQPADFIPLAEETGLIVALGTWVMRQACANAATWPENLKVAVNLSPVQFGSVTLVEDVAAALADAGLDPCRLELEITETAILADSDAVLLILHQLRDLGLRIALDDFGTGFSSLSYLQRFPFNKVKIDRSFVAQLGHGGDTDTIVAAVVDLCHRLGMATTGEGVETAAQLGRLDHFNCMEAQGYLFSRPRPAGEVADMLLKLSVPERAM